MSGAALFLPAAPAFGLTGDEIAVIANKQEKKGLKLARFYMEKRGIPEKNLITVNIKNQEACSRSDYDSLIAQPVRAFLNDQQQKIRCLVTTYGVPLKITSPSLTAPGRKVISDLRKKKEELSISLSEENDDELKKTVQKQLSRVKKQIAHLKKIHDMRSSVDSELALVLRVHPLAHWLTNPFYKGNVPGSFSIGRDDVVMVSRLDGPSPESVKKIIIDSLQTEKKGLQGSAFFDARWPDPGLKPVQGYGVYDRSIHRAADIVRQSGKVGEVVVDEKNSLFAPGSHLSASLYCGWYSLAKYVDAFDWQTGSVGYHIASSECSTLKKKKSQVWCKKMIEKGVAATVGPVGEPYVQAFPPPDLFFSFLLSGKTLVESYFFSLPHLSWKMVLVGDPLYRPFAKDN